MSGKVEDFLFSEMKVPKIPISKDTGRQIEGAD